MATPPDEETVRERLRSVNYPGLNRDVVSFGFVKEIEVGTGGVSIRFEPSTDREDVVRQMTQAMESAVGELEGVGSVDVTVPSGEGEGGGAPPGETGGEHTSTPPGPAPSGKEGGKVAAAAPGATTTPGSGPMDQQPIPGVDHIVAVASGKGGVGKSTVAVNLAAALRERGHSVGLGDMDIYGPSAPTMLGLRERPRINADEKITPPTSQGIRSMSIGYVLSETEPVVWRGPMVMKAVTQFLRDVDWGELDYLVLDLPPGTGDAQLTLMQKVPLSGAVIVTTPQDVALIDAQKSVEMFRKLNVRILGIVENMSGFVCPECGHESHVFGSGGGRKEALRLDVPFLGGVPLDPDVREGGDSGRPVVLEHPEGQPTSVFLDVAREVTERAEPVETVMDRLEDGTD